ncbi:MAG: response regulator transcription factor [Dehalococcoidaceae bacterium]|nr:response regulator transcription factor [Dehalococcoidaceae bacterium]
MQGNKLKELKIVLIFPCETIRNAIGALLKQYEIENVSLFDSCEEFDSQSRKISADLILIHYSRCTESGAIKRIIQETGAYVALLASSDSYHWDSYQDILERLLEGITGFLDLDEPVYTFLSELEDIACGDIVISGKFAQNMIQKTRPVDTNLDEALSQRELQILTLVADGKTNKEIGEALNISPHTLKGHLTNILTKLNLKNRQQAVAYIMTRRLK